MSGIAAIIRFDGGMVEPGAIEKMTAAMDYRGPDGIRHWANGPVALGQCMLRTTAESLEEVQPLANEDESLLLVMDGWLSNWEELRSDLLTRGARLRTRSDAELVLRAYEAWGEDCPRHIDGEYAFVIWDARRQEAFVTHDHIGLKTLHYHWDGKRLLVASDIVGILAGPDVEQKPNHARIAEYLTFNWITRGETIWEGVMRAVPAHWMRFGKAGYVSEKYWEPPFEVSIRYKRDEDYFEHYRELFTDTVRRSSRTHRPLACDVSGGLDSSAVFAMAHELRSKGRLFAPDVKGYTYHFADAIGAKHDEIEYAREVARHVGKEVKEVSPFLPDLSWFEHRSQDDQDIAGYPNGAMSIAIGGTLVDDGCRVLLNGEGGDEWLAGKPTSYAEQISDCDWQGVSRSISEDFADIGLFRTLRILLRFGFAPSMPDGFLKVRRRILEALKPSDLQHAVQNASWLTNQYKEACGEHCRSRRGLDYTAISNLPQRSKYMVMTDPFALVVWDQFSRQSARLGYEIRTPMYARRFIEFAFATPERIRLRGNTRKYIHIKALDGLLPDLVANRKTKAEFSVAFTRLIGEIERSMMDAPQASKSGYLNAPGLSALFDQRRRDPTNGMLLWHLWSIFEIDRLLVSR